VLYGGSVLKVYAGFAGAERKNGEIVSRPASVVADDEHHAQAQLLTKARETWPEKKGWHGHCAYVRLVPIEQMNMDERIIPTCLAETFKDMGWEIMDM
jgi:uroporphyrinogen-III decarboxylase